MLRAVYACWIRNKTHQERLVEEIFYQLFCQVGCYDELQSHWLLFSFIAYPKCVLFLLIIPQQLVDNSKYPFKVKYLWKVHFHFKMAINKFFLTRKLHKARNVIHIYVTQESQFTHKKPALKSVLWWEENVKEQLYLWHSFNLCFRPQCCWISLVRRCWLIIYNSIAL